MTMLRFLRRFTLAILTLACVLVGACEEPPINSEPVGFQKVSGVLNDENGFIVPGALVEAVNGSDARIAADTSDETGGFALTGLPSNLNDVQVRVLHSDFKLFESPVTGLVSAAGGNEGVTMSLFSNDTCCGLLTITVTTADNLPLPGVEVKLRKKHDLKTVGVTDSNGVVRFRNICFGEYNVRLAKKGYAVVERDGINIRNCELNSLEFGMRPGGNDNPDSCCNGVLRIIPRDSTTNAIITGAEVKIQRQGGNARFGTTNADGIIFREMCAGTYGVRISKGDYKVIEFSISIECNDSVATERRMVSKKPLPDTCCDGKAIIIPRDSSTNEVLNGAKVKLWKGNTVIGTQTVENGKATFSDLCKGDYVAEITREGYKRQEMRLGLECNARQEFTKHMGRETTGDSCCQGVLEIIVRDSTNNAVVRGATVKLWRNGSIVATKTTDSNGVARFGELCKGKYGVDLIREGYKSREFSTELGCNQRKEVTQRLLRKEDGPCCTAKFVFRTKDSTNSTYIPGVIIEIRKGNDLVARGETSGEGRYIREALCGNSTYTVSFTKQGYITKTITVNLTECRTVEETIWLMTQ